MKRWLVAGALLWRCASVENETRSDAELYKPVAPKKSTAELKAKPVEMPVSAEVRIDPANDSGVRGAGRFAVDHGVVTMDLVFNGLSPGTHAITLQESCEGEHWNPTNARHGRFDAAPFHLGDVGNFFANPDGHGSLTFATELWSVGTSLTNDVVDRFVVVRAGKDDFKSDPNGGAGEVVGCGRVELSQLTQPAVSMTGRLIEQLK